MRTADYYRKSKFYSEFRCWRDCVITRRGTQTRNLQVKQQYKFWALTRALRCIFCTQKDATAITSADFPYFDQGL
mgnify:CR=1